LICEELLDHLLKSGYRKIGVTVKGRKMRVIEIRAEGEDSSHHSYHLDKNDENDENVKRMMRSEEDADAFLYVRELLPRLLRRLRFGK
jgi:hypothetical protein